MHTRSGKPIALPAPLDGAPADLLTRGALFVAAHSDGYARRDHLDAHAVLITLAKTARAEGDMGRAYWLGAVASAHKAR